MNIGDKVRFLFETGGGIVKGFQGKDIVLVEDENGFSIPMLIRECVAIDTNEYNFEKKSVKASPNPSQGGESQASQNKKGSPQSKPTAFEMSESPLLGTTRNRASFATTVDLSATRSLACEFKGGGLHLILYATNTHFSR